MFVMRMPQLGMGMTDGDIISWLVHEGQSVTEGEELVLIETNKVEETLEAPASGTILQVLVAEGATVPVGSPILLIGDPGEQLPDPSDLS